MSLPVINTKVKDYAPAAKKQTTTTKERMAGFVGWLLVGRKVVNGERKVVLLVAGCVWRA